MKQDESPHPHELVSAFSDQVTTPQETARLQEHLRNCPECRQWLHDLNALATAVGEEAVPPPPPQLAAKIRQRIEAGSASIPSPRTVSFWRSPFPPAMAATILMAATIVLIWRRETVPPNAPVTQAVPSSAAGSKSATGPVPAEPSAPSAPPPAAVKSDAARNEATARELRSLGYVRPALDQATPAERTLSGAGDTGARAPIPAPPSRAKQNAPLQGSEAVEKAPSPGSESQRRDYLDLITSSGLTGEDYKKVKERQAPAGAAPGKDNLPSALASSGEMSAQASGESTQPAPSEGARSLAYEGPSFSATFSEDGLVTVIARGFACSATVPVPSAAPGGGTSRTVEDIPSLFRIASSREFLATGTSRENTQKPSAAPAPAATSSLALRNGDGDPIHSVPFTEPLSQEAPQVLRTLRQGIQLLIQQRYRKELETRCGPLPAALLSTP